MINMKDAKQLDLEKLDSVVGGSSVSSDIANMAKEEAKRYLNDFENDLKSGIDNLFNGNK